MAAVRESFTTWARREAAQPGAAAVFLAWAVILLGGRHGDSGDAALAGLLAVLTLIACAIYLWDVNVMSLFLSRTTIDL